LALSCGFFRYASERIVSSYAVVRWGSGRRRPVCAVATAMRHFLLVRPLLPQASPDAPRAAWLSQAALVDV
jgi:hypothetical protein